MKKQIPKIKKVPGRPFVKGDVRAGRPVGCRNKFTTLKDAFINAFKRIGGEDALVKFYNSKNPSDKRALLQMLSSMLPKDVQLSGSLDMRVSNIKGIIDHASKTGSAGKPGGIRPEVPANDTELEK